MKKDSIVKCLDKYFPESLIDCQYKEETYIFLKNNENFYSSTNPMEHITVSACIIDYTNQYILLHKHKKFDEWMYLGGHCEEEDSSIFNSVLREAKEECGLKKLRIQMESIFDIDIHKIPRFFNEAEHKHYDLRFLLYADKNEDFIQSIESTNMCWIEIKEADKFLVKESLLKTLYKIIKYCN